MRTREVTNHALYIEIYNKIKKEIINGKYPPGSMLPTELELAEMYYVSRITIQKAMQLLKSEGYISRTAGRGTFVERIPDKPQKHTIGLVLCNIASSFGLQILTAIERTASKYGYQMIFRNSLDNPEEETRAINDLVAFGVEGLIIQPVHNEFYNETLIRLHCNNFPIVLVDRCFTGFSIPSVSTNHSDAAQSLTKYLFDKGHAHIAFMCSPQTNTSSVQERINGFTSVYMANNYPLSEIKILNSIISPHSADDEEIFRKDIEIIKNYLNENPSITAMISSEFTITKLIIQAVKEIGKSIPEDYSLVMFDGYESVDSSLVTHVQQGQAEIGRIAMETLLTSISDKVAYNKIYVPFKIIEGNSVKDLTK